MPRFDIPSMGVDNATSTKYTGTPRPGPFSGTYGSGNSNQNTGGSSNRNTSGGSASG